MRARVRALTLLGVLSACATPPAPKMRFEEAFPPSSATGGASLEQGNSPGSPAGHGLNPLLMTFSQRARQHRERAERGGAMPASQVENWQGLIALLDGYLRRADGEVVSHEVVRARLVLESELELDSRAYGDMPAALADDVVERINRLASRMAELKRHKARIQEARVTFAWPLEPVNVTSLFGRRLNPITKVYQQHKGVDLAAGRGQSVTAAARGMVLRAGFGEGFGNYVELEHGRGVMTRYGHLSRILVEPGLRVNQGDVIGLAGSTGMATGTHLHFELWRDGEAVDPLEELEEPSTDEEVPVADRQARRPP